MTNPNAPSLAEATRPPVYSPLSDRDGAVTQSERQSEWTLAQRFGFRFGRWEQLRGARCPLVQRYLDDER